MGKPVAATGLASGRPRTHSSGVIFLGADNVGLSSVIQPVAQTMIPTGDLALGSVMQPADKIMFTVNGEVCTGHAWGKA
jgi:hypothetical protein